MLPVLGALILQAAYGAVDLLVVGRFGSTSGLSAVSTGSQVLNLVTFVVTQLAVGVTVLIARYLGERCPEQIGAVIGGAAVVFALVSALLFAVPVGLARPIAVVMQAPAEAVTLTASYVRICGGGTFFIVAYNLLSAIFRGLGDSRSPLLFVLVACLVNVAGDLLLEGGAVSGYEASKLSGVARSKIYTILEALIQRGAVLSSSDGRATLYRAESPAHLAELLRGEMDRGLRHLGSWESARSRCLRMIREAREQVMLQIWADELDEELEDAIVRRQAELEKVVVIFYDAAQRYETRIPDLYCHGFEQDKLREWKGRWLLLETDGQEMIYAGFSREQMTEAIYTRNFHMTLLACECIRHDAYCTRLRMQLPPGAREVFGDDMEGIRDVFDVHGKYNANRPQGQKEDA